MNPLDLAFKIERCLDDFPLREYPALHREFLQQVATALRAALAQQQAEPVAWMVNVDVQNWQGQSEYRTMLAFRPDPAFIGGYAINGVTGARPLIYGDTAPPAQQAEPVVDDCTPNHLCVGRWVHKPADEICSRCGHE
jgi:hypothetical protein